MTLRNLRAIGALFLACLGLDGCSTPPPAPAPPKIAPGTSDQQMIEFAKQWFDAFNAHDAERLAALYSEQAYVFADQDAYQPKPYFTQLIESRPSIHAEQQRFGWYLFDKDVGFMEHRVDITETIAGTPQSKTLNFVIALRYRDGQWRIYGHHVSGSL